MRFSFCEAVYCLLHLFQAAQTLEESRLYVTMLSTKFQAIPCQDSRFLLLLLLEIDLNLVGYVKG